VVHLYLQLWYLYFGISLDFKTLTYIRNSYSCF